MSDQEPVAWAVWHLSEEAPGRIAYAKPIQSLRGTGETRDGEEFIPLYGKPTLSEDDHNRLTYIIEGLEDDKDHDQWEVDFLKELQEKLA
jgi:hypothetical protein